MALQAFHNDPALKEKYVSQLRGYMEGNSPHAEAWDPVELGIPEWLADVAATLFTQMSKEKSRTWLLKFLEAIKPGVELERIKGPFLVMVLTSARETFDPAEFPQLKVAIDGVIALWKREDPGSPEFLEAARAAGEEARVAQASSVAAFRDAVRTAGAQAAHSARAWAAEVASEAAAVAEAASAAAEEVNAAAQAVADPGTEAEPWPKYDYFADELLKLLADAPMAAVNADK